MWRFTYARYVITSLCVFVVWNKFFKLRSTVCVLFHDTYISRCECSALCILVSQYTQYYCESNTMQNTSYLGIRLHWKTPLSILNPNSIWHDALTHTSQNHKWNRSRFIYNPEQRRHSSFHRGSQFCRRECSLSTANDSWRWRLRLNRVSTGELSIPSSKGMLEITFHRVSLRCFLSS